MRAIIILVLMYSLGVILSIALEIYFVIIKYKKLTVGDLAVIVVLSLLSWISFFIILITTFNDVSIYKRESMSNTKEIQENRKS